MFNVALLGLGVMGTGIAHNLLKAGFPLTVYNRTRARAEPLAAAGARVAETPAAAVAGAQVIISMVGDDAASRAVWLGDPATGSEDGALAAAVPDAVLVECSTLSPAWVRELAGLAAERGLGLLDAPVAGSKDAAAAGQLKLMVGGEAALLERARPALDAFSRQIVHFGPSGSGAVVKLINNLMGAVHVAALAEGLVLAERAGLDMEQVVELLVNGAPGSPIVKGKIGRMVAHDYDNTEFALKWMHKDASYALSVAEDLGVPMPTLAAAREVYQAAVGRGDGDKDFAAVYEAARQSKQHSAD